MELTFFYRDMRVANAATAFAIEQNAINDLQVQIGINPAMAGQLVPQLVQHQIAASVIAAELQVLGASTYPTSDANAILVAFGMLGHWSPEIVAAIAADAAFLAGNGRPLTDAESDLLANTRADNGVAALEAAISAGLDLAVAQRLVAFALGRWLRRFPETRGWTISEVGVLLPLRLETLFEGADNQWTLLLRVIPDEASILRNSSTVTATEAEFLAAFWAGSSVGQFGPNAAGFEWLIDPRGQVAWEALASRVTPQRAAYLLGAFPAKAEAGGFVAPVPADRIGETEPQRIGGLPAELRVYIVDANKGRIELDPLQPAPPDDELRLPQSKDDFTGNWLLSWPRAQDVGMGKEYPLPSGVTPETITALYVCGLGDETPEAHFQAHVDAGDLALMRLGSPTNTVQGAAAADLDKDAESWRIIIGRRLSGEVGAAVPGIGQALCGNTTALPYLGGDSRDLDDSHLLVATLWPALWGHFTRDIWSRVDDFQGLWKWSKQNLHPEGPLLPLRIGTQPYGLLPVTSLRNWQPFGDEFDATETRMVAKLRELLPIWAAKAVDRGTVAKGGTGNLLRLLGQPGVSANYIYRSFANVDWLTSVYGSVTPSTFKDAANALWADTAKLMGDGTVPHAYLAAGFAAPLDLPLIGSDRLLPDGLTLWDMREQIYRIDGGHFADQFYGMERELVGVMHRIVPRSLLVRLAMHSMFLVKAWLVAANGANEPIVNPAIWNDPDDVASTPLEHDQDGFWTAYSAGLLQPADLKSELLKLTEAHDENIAFLFGILDQHLTRAPDPHNPNADPVMQLTLPPEREAQLERALRATLDSATHRIDPLATGIAWRRLQQQIDSGNSRHRLGAYGWLDGPFDGRPGPTDAGRLHAPSRSQAITGIVLRDKQLSSEDEHEPGAPNIWQMNLESASVRAALAMAEDIRAGFHIYEVVGRQVEGIVGGKGQIEALRTAVPLRPDRPDVRDTCNGIVALERLLKNKIPNVLSPVAKIADEQRAKLKALDAALDTFADLLVAEGVHQVVSGHADLAADAMDAAAGFARPPEFEFTRTPPSGYRLSTSVLAVLQHVEPFGTDDTALPIERADASLAAFLEEHFAGADWVWKMTLPDHTQRATWLADMGLTPLATLLLSEDTMIEIVRSLRQQPDGIVQSPPEHRLMRQLAGLLGAPPTLAEASRKEEIASTDASGEQTRQRDQLLARFTDLRRALFNFRHEAVAPDDDARRDWLRRSLGWGVIPALEGQARHRLFDLLWGGAPPVEDELSKLIDNGKSTLAKRLPLEDPENAPATADDLPPMTDASPATLVRAISELLLPGSRMALTTMWEPDTLLAATGLRIATPDASVEPDWLTVVAAVRPPLARLEAMQLEATMPGAPMPPLTAWTNIPDDDHWQTKDVEKNVAQRALGTDLSQLTLGRFITAFGPANAWQNERVAVGLIDAFSEAVPMIERSTYAAFGFNAPAARPPQAILLAVPPQFGAPLDPDTLVDILEETRELLRARAAAPEDLSGFPLVPSMWFDGASAMRLRLDAGSQYWR